MEQHNEREILDDILNAYVASVSVPDHTALAAWVRRYPQYERELTEFTVNWSLSESLPQATEREEAHEDALVLRGMSIVQNILHEQGQHSKDKDTAFEGILKEGANRGLTIHQIAERTQLSVTLVRKLDRRLILFDSIPREAIEALAHAMYRGGTIIARYLQQVPLLPQGASYRAEQAPRLSQPENFFDAVRNDLTMTEANRIYWLAFASNTD